MNDSRLECQLKSLPAKQKIKRNNGIAWREMNDKYDVCRRKGKMENEME